MSQSAHLSFFVCVGYFANSSGEKGNGGSGITGRYFLLSLLGMAPKRRRRGCLHTMVRLPAHAQLSALRPPRYSTGYRQYKFRAVMQLFDGKKIILIFDLISYWLSLCICLVQHSEPKQSLRPPQRKRTCTPLSLGFIVAANVVEIWIGLGLNLHVFV